MSKKYYYKVVDEDLWSVVAQNTSLRVQYKLNEWVTPRVAHTDLMVFKDLDYAKAFCQYMMFQSVYKCQVKNPRKRGLMIYYRYIRNGGTIPPSLESLIKIRMSKQKYLDHITSKPPLGTIFCSAVKLLEKVY